MMKIVKIVLIHLLLLSCIVDGGSKLLLTKRAKCKNDAEYKLGAFDTVTCLHGLNTFSATERTASDFIILQCLNYQFEIAKCNKESDVLPPDFKP